MTPIDQLSECVEKRVSKRVSNPRNNDKTKISFWKRRIFKPTYFRDGVKLTSPNFCVELQHTDRVDPANKKTWIEKRVRWSLGPCNPEVAAAKARDLFLYLVANGWPATLAKFRPDKAKSAKSADPTIGEFLAAVTATADLTPKTLRGYTAALRKIVADITGLASDRSKFGYGKAHKAWLSKLHAEKLSVLSQDAVQEWKRSFLAKASQDPLSQRSAKVSVNGFLRCAKCLFSPAILKHLEGKIQLPATLPFAGVSFEPKPSCKYRSTFDVHKLIEAARDELASSAPEAYKVFLLATFVGLRRKEIDLLEWPAFKWEQGVISIEPTQHFAAKSEDSYADVAIDTEMVTLFRGFAARATGPFVVESPEPPRPEVTYDYYRCDAIFDSLIRWLRDHGCNGLKPLHTLRKEFGSMICATAGIHAASRALRHSAVAVTDAFYTDSRKRVSLGLGHLLEPAKVIEFKQEVA